MKAPPRVRIFVAAAGAAGAATLVLAARAGGASGIHRPVVFIAFCGALALSWAVPLLMFRGGETEAFQLDEAFLVAMALLLPDFAIILAFALGVGLGQLARRRAPIRAVFNIGQSVTAAGSALLVMHIVGRTGGPTTARSLVAVILAAATFSLVQTGFVAGVIALAEGKPFKSEFLDGLSVRLLIWVGNVSAGLLAGLVGYTYPWALGFAAIPVAVLQLVFAGHLRARRDRERMNGLFETAVEAHASVGIRDVEEAIAESARSLLRCDQARFDSAPPQQRELGIKVTGAVHGDRWLIVSERRGVEPFDAADRNLLEAIVAIGAAALDNASLYKQAYDERKKLADVVGSSSDGIFSVDLDGRITSWNPAMERITEFKAEEMTGTRHLGALRPRDAQGADVIVEGWISVANMPPPDMQILTSAGEVRWVNCTFSPMSDGGYVVVARDVTAQKELDELKTDFLATISHELRTPLTPIQGFIQTLLRSDADYSEEQRKGFYEIILRQSERLGRLVGELLDAVSMQERQPSVHIQEVDWVGAVSGVVDMMRSQHPEREFTFEELGSVPAAAADERRAEQVLSNLLTNAVKYGDPDWPIEVKVEAKGSEITTTVSDRGPGISPADRERIFERFTRLGDHLTRTAGGVGLGLYIARRLVEGMRGRIWVEAAPQGGAQFMFSLPCFGREERPAAQSPSSHNRYQE